MIDPTGTLGRPAAPAGGWLGRVIPARWLHRARAAGWALADQAISSLTNLALGLVAARTLAPDAFGAFGVAFVTYTIALGLYRAVAADPLVVRHTRSSGTDQRAAVASASGAALATGVLTGTVCLAASTFTRGALSEGFAGLGIVLPGLLLQDIWRYWFFTRREGVRAFANDLSWAAILAVALVLLVATHRVSIFTLLLAWGGAATAAAALGMAQARIVPHPALAWRWWRGHRDLAPRYVGEFLAMTGAGQVAVYAIGAIAGLYAVGALRGAWILLGPLNVLFMGGSLVAVPEGIRLLGRSGAALRRTGLLLSAALGSAGLLWGAVLLLFQPSGIGEQLLGANWPASRTVLLPLVMAGAATGVTAGSAIGLRALGASRRSLRANVMVSSMTVVAAVGGALAGGVEWGAWGFAVAAWIGTAIWWREFSAGLRDHNRLAATTDAAVAHAPVLT